eukprot:c7152_g1_i1.p1 GENE.c7152_g1_i1~~c7152_g1_i1.p1  ORF type:complete len:369 (+),score=89.44 c7152_g1_i1:32-1108(+)
MSDEHRDKRAKVDADTEVSIPNGPPEWKKRILVAGGCGFIGASLCSRLVEQGHDVICMDNFFTSQKSNVNHLVGKPNFELLRHDVTLPIKLEIDQIYNLACPAAPGHYQYNPIKTIRTAILGTMNLLELARESRARILQASTSEVYGNPSVHPQPETYFGNVNPIGVRACYDEGKRAGETLMFDYHRMHKVDIKVVRIFNTYGPYMHPYDGRVVSNFIRQAIQNEDITIYGTGEQTRSFQYIDDLVEGMIRMMNSPRDFIGPVNLGNPVEFSINQLAHLVIQQTGSQSKIIQVPAAQDDPERRKPDITLANAKLDWRPVVPLEKGLQKTVEYFKKIDFARFRPPTDQYGPPTSPQPEF